MLAATANSTNALGTKSANDFHVAACIAHPEHAGPILQHAFALGKSLDADVTLLQVLEEDRASNRPDPIEWDLRRHEARRLLNEMASPPDASMARANIHLTEGFRADEIQRFAHDHNGSLLVIGMQEPNARRCRGIGGTIHHLLHSAAGYMLLVPCNGHMAPVTSYRRILVPVDGSTWAASALPLAVRLAQANNAELLLAHVIPPPELTETRPYDAADIALREQVIERNQQTADAYLERMRQYVADMKVRVRIISTQCKDVRAKLEQIIRTENADLVIMSARGHGLSANADMPYGSVASYLMMHSPAPLLVIPATSGAAKATARPSNGQASEVRMPMFNQV